MLQTKDINWLNEYKNKTHIYAVYKRPTSDLGTYRLKARGWKKKIRVNGNQKLYRQTKVKRIQHHQTSFTTSAKGAFIGRKHRRWKRPKKANQKRENDNRNIYINDYFKCKWIKRCNQRTWTV